MFEGMVVKFVSRAAHDHSVLDVAMQLQTNVSIRGWKKGRDGRTR